MPDQPFGASRPRTKGCFTRARRKNGRLGDPAFWLTVWSSDLVSGSSPTRPSMRCVKEHRLRYWNRCVPFGVVRPRTPVATGYCYRLLPEETGFRPKNGHFALRTVAERQGFEPWDR